jgi:hypothetical protein
MDGVNLMEDFGLNGSQASSLPRREAPLLISFIIIQSDGLLTLSVLYTLHKLLLYYFARQNFSCWQFFNFIYQDTS